jgi:hypothetical protein
MHPFTGLKHFKEILLKINIVFINFVFSVAGSSKLEHNCGGTLIGLIRNQQHILYKHKHKIINKQHSN